MVTFILVHGSFHGSWCWRRVVPLLEAKGHRAVAVDLPGHGADRTTIAGQSLATYVERVTDMVDAQREPVVLVGHSMGGVVVTQAAEDRSKQVARIVYVCAFLPRDGESLLELAQTDKQSRLLPNLVFGEGLHWVRSEAAAEIFYHDCPEADAAEAQALLVREPLSVVETRVRVTGDRYGTIPRTYIECTEDRALGPDLQRRMHGATPCTVLTLPTGHSPFFAAPAEVVDHLISTQPP
jgi:pimeloyl-ACP methyl ester carboxylesterase